jgi:hypothetical protein
MHCSSSSSTTVTSSSSSSKSTTSSSAASSTSSSVASSATSATSAKSSTASSAAANFPIDASAGDTDASCQPPEGGLFCDPGKVACGDAGLCDVPTQECCQNTTNACIAAGGSCGGTPIECNEAADCPAGKICCIASSSTTASSAAVTCQTPVNGGCPAAVVASAQICRSNKECPSGKCSFWSCAGNTIEACTVPTPSAPGLCTQE